MVAPVGHQQPQRNQVKNMNKSIIRCIHCDHAARGHLDEDRFAQWDFGPDGEFAEPNEYGVIWGICNLCKQRTRAET